MKKLSVVIPIYNVQDYLRKCVDSVLKQRYEEMEILLVDDGSTDESGKLADQIASENPELVKVIHQENKGLGGARNTGIEASEGEFIWFIDSDDYIDENAIGKINEAINKYNPDAIVFDYVNVDEDGNIIENVSATLDKEITNLDESPELFFIAQSACNKVFRRSLFMDNNIRFPERDWFEDLATTVNLYPYMKKVAFIKKGFYKYLQRKDSITHNSNVKRNIEIIKASESVVNFYKDKGLYETYKDEITYLLVLNAYVVTPVRVIKNKGNKEILKQIKEYVYSRFPDFHTNKYILNMSKKEKLIIKLLDSDNFALLSILLRIKEMLKR